MKLSEIARVDRYYQQNPDKIKDLNLPKAYDREYRRGEEAKMLTPKAVYDKFNREFAGQWKNVFSQDLYKKLFDETKNVIKIWVLDIFDAIDKGQLDKVPELLASSSKVSLTPDEINELSNNIVELYKSYRLTNQKKSWVSQRYESSKAKKAQRAGLSLKDYDAGMEWIAYFTADPGKTIPEEVWPVIQKLTVNPATLPKTVYRGIFVKSSKIEDREQWLKDWAPGSKPNIKFNKPNSWSSSIGVAAQFMGAKDYSQETKNGFSVLLKYNITDPSVVIGDFRNLKTAKFWNEQEILLSPDAVGYEVAKVIPFTDQSEPDLEKFTKQVSAPDSQERNLSFADTFVKYFFDFNNLQISKSDKEQMKVLSKMTVAQVKERTDLGKMLIGNYDDTFSNTLFPLFVIVQSENSKLANDWAITFDRNAESQRKNAITAYITSYGPDEGRRTSDTVRDILKDVTGYAVADKLALAVTITLDNGDYNSMKFSVIPRGDFFILNGDTQEKSTSDAAEKANQLLKNSSVRQRLMDDVQQALENSNLAQHKNVTIQLK